MNEAMLADAVNIHPQAVVDPAARLGRGVSVGPFTVVGPHVVLGDGCQIHNNVTIVGHTRLGRHCEVYPGCVLGARPQDLKYQGEVTALQTGDHNVFRELVTAHPGTRGGGGITRIGHRNLFMISAHIGHDVTIGDDCILANQVGLAGHVVIEDCVTVGGMAGVHHFTTLGKHSMIGGLTKITTDVPPFLTVAGTRTARQEVRMVNGVGMKRRGFTEEQIRNVKLAYMRLFSRRARSSGVPVLEIVTQLRAENIDDNVNYLCDFLLRSFECGRHGR